MSDKPKPILTRMVKLHNRRVFGAIFSDGGVSFVFKRLDGRWHIKTTRIDLSHYAFMAMGAISCELRDAYAAEQSKKGGAA
jgi:hypothetical protein